MCQVIKQDPTPAKNFPDESIHWICECQLCKTIVSVSGKRLRSGETKSCGCMKSVGEQTIQKFLNEKNTIFKKEYSFSDLVSNNNCVLRFDFAIFKDDNLKYLIEYQGPQHFKTIKIFSEDIPLDLRKKYDAKKEEYCIQNNIPLLVIIPTNLNHHQNNNFSKIGSLIEEFEKELEGENNNVKISHKYF